MPVVKEVVAHILYHVNAEASDRDDSQTPGVGGRAQYVRKAVESLLNDTRDFSLNTILQTISVAAIDGGHSVSFRRALTNMIDNHSPQLAIQEWVGKGWEQPGG